MNELSLTKESLLELVQDYHSRDDVFHEVFLGGIVFTDANQDIEINLGAKKLDCSCPRLSVVAFQKRSNASYRPFHHRF